MNDRVEEVTKDDPRLVPLACPVAGESYKIWLGLWRDEVAIAWGIVPESLLSDRAYVWAQGTPLLRQCRRTFLRRTRVELAKLHREYPQLWGLCRRDTVWLDHLGVEYGEWGGGYSSFELRAK